VSRVESRPTHELWGTSEEDWIKYLVHEGMIDVLISYYETGIFMMEKLNRDVLKEKTYGEILGHKVGMDIMMSERSKTIDFYRLRLKELEE